MNSMETETQDAVPAVVRESVRITPQDAAEVRQITLEVDEPAFRVAAGQNIALGVPGELAFGGREHLRRYSVAEVLEQDEESVFFTILVRRCFYIDEVSGERYPGVASNYLCDARPGETIPLYGPYRAPFKIPPDTSANLLMIGTGTGIAPFRGLVKAIYQKGLRWQGQVRLFYGARNGMELLYMNDHNADLTNYYDEDTFRAFTGLAGRPLSDERDGLEKSISANVDEAWELLQQANTYVFLAGLDKTADATDRVLAAKAGGSDAWEAMKQRLRDQGRWAELLYS
jgi:ferredoxin--NADP+ reductase